MSPNYGNNRSRLQYMYLYIYHILDILPWYMSYLLGFASLIEPGEQHNQCQIFCRCKHGGANHSAFRKQGTMPKEIDTVDG